MFWSFRDLRLHWETPAFQCQSPEVPREDSCNQNLPTTHACPAQGSTANLHLSHTRLPHTPLSKQIFSQYALKELN